MSPRELQYIRLRQEAIYARLNDDKALGDHLDAKADDVWPGARWVRVRGWDE